MASPHRHRQESVKETEAQSQDCVASLFGAWGGRDPVLGFPVAQRGRIRLQRQRRRRCGFDPWVRKILLEKGMATHSSVLAWSIPRIEKPTVHRVAQSQTLLKCLRIHDVQQTLFFS